MDERYDSRSSAYQGETVRERSEVENATDTLDKALSELSAILSGLEQRLAPVIRGTNEKVAGNPGTTPMPQHSPIVMTLHNFSGRVQNEIVKVNMLIQSIQL